MPRKEPKEFRTTFSTYVANGVVGEGGSGTVYSAEDDTGSPVAVKLLDRAKATRERLKRFENEYRFCSQADHSNIIRVTDHGLHEDNAPFFVMPLYDGSLRKLMKNGLLPAQILPVLFKIMDGLEAAHLLDVIHRDVKPENILFKNGGEDLVVADFGIAQFTAEDLYTAVETKPHTRLANFQYAAPEQRSRGVDTDQRTDIYALGLILNEMFTGTIPSGTNYKSISATTDELPYLDPIVTAMLSQDPDSRPDSIRQIRQELNSRQRDFLSHQKLSKLKNKVIPEEEIDDPLAHTPPTIVDIDWDQHVLTITLDQPIHNRWVSAFNNMGNYSFVLGRGPQTFKFAGPTARVSAKAEQVQDIINHFKVWLPLATKKYHESLQQEQANATRHERGLIERRKRAEEERQRVLRDVKF
jgi:serine/threonine protein kinase